MKLKKIKVKNFKSIYDTLTINFDDVKGLWRITGPVGAGKTTIGEAIIFGLFGELADKKLGDIVSWGEKKGQMELWLESKGHEIYIQRTFGKSSTLYADIDGEELLFTNKKDAQKQLETEYYDVSKLTVQLLCIISFNNFKSISSMNTADTKNFLDQVFGFYILTKYGEACKQFKKENAVLINEANTQIVSINSQIDKLNKLAQEERISGETQKAKKEAERLSGELNSLNTTQLSAIKPFDDRLRELSAKMGQITSEGQRLNKEIEFIKRGVCPTCGAPIDQSHLPEKEAKKKELGTQWKQYNEESKKVEGEKNLKIQEFNTKRTKLKTEYDAAYSLYNKLYMQDKRDAIDQKAIETLNESLSENKSKYNEYKKDEDEWNELYNVITGDVKSALLMNFVELLNKSIQEYTTKLHQPWKIAFDDSFHCNINIFGMPVPIPTSSLSTGQLKTVDMSIILGILNVIMSNINFNILFLDELFSNMDAILRDDMCQVLKENLQSEQTMFVISHTELDGKWFDGGIDITNELHNGFRKSIFKIG